MKRQSARCFVQAPGASPWSKVPHVASTGVEEVEHYPAGPSRDVASHVRGAKVNDDSPGLMAAGRSPVPAVHLLPRPCCLFSCRRTTPGYSSVKADLPDIAEKAVSSLIKTQGIGDLYRLYAIAKRDRIDYNYIDIHSQMKDDKGELKQEITGDGLHLNAEGYKIWKAQIDKTMGWGDESKK